jgi:hypothetical protein
MALLLTGCQKADEAVTMDYVGFDSYGDVSKLATSSADVVTPVRLVSDVSKLEGKTVTVSGTVREVCQMAGCWLTLDTSDASSDAPTTTIRVSVPRDENGEYVFTVPTDISGRTVFVTGVVQESEVDAAMAEHYAEDAATMMEHDGAMEHDAMDGHDTAGEHAGVAEHDDDGQMNGHDMDTEGEAAAENAPTREIKITAVGISFSPVVTAP